MMSRASRFRLSVIAGSICLFPLLSALGCGGTPPARKTYTYILTSQQVDQSWTSSVAQFQVADDGVLKPLSPPIVPLGNGAISIAASPDGRYLYALEGTLSQGAYILTFLRFSINNDGTLAPNPVTSPGPSWGYPFTLSPDGRFAFVPWGDMVTSYSISTSGQFTFASTVPAGSNACTVAIDPTGQFAFVGNHLDQTISEYRIGADGTLTPIGTISSAPTWVYLLRFSPDGYLYSAGSGGVALTQYSVDASTGALTELNQFAAGPNDEPWSFVFDPAGSYAYAANAGPEGYTVSSFIANTVTGSLSQNGPDIPSALAELHTDEIAVDPSGNFVFWLQDDRISQFRIGGSGTLVPNGETSMVVGNGETSGAIAFVQR
jgi:6-phosphogluconolactonase (cycloisomerase 2 family)